MPTNHAHNFTVDFARPRHDERPKTYPKGRVCVEQGCITILHRYHKGPWCHTHEDQHEVQVPDVEPVDPFGPLFVPLYRAPVTV